MLLLIESESEEALNTGSEELLSTLDEHPDVAYAISTPPREWFEENLAWVTNDKDLDDLLHMGNQSNLTRAACDPIAQKKTKACFGVTAL